MDAISEYFLDSLHADVDCFEVNFANTEQEKLVI